MVKIRNNKYFILNTFYLLLSCVNVEGYYRKLTALRYSVYYRTLDSGDEVVRDQCNSFERKNI